MSLKAIFFSTFSRGRAPSASVTVGFSSVSWNTRYVSSQGFDCQLTLRGTDATEVLRQAHELLARMAEAGVKPTNGGKAGSGDTRLCPIHQVPMKLREKDGQVWYSHRTEDGGWCRGK